MRKITLKVEEEIDLWPSVKIEFTANHLDLETNIWGGEEEHQRFGRHMIFIGDAPPQEEMLKQLEIFNKEAQRAQEEFFKECQAKREKAERKAKRNESVR